MCSTTSLAKLPVFTERTFIKTIIILIRAQGNGSTCFNVNGAGNSILCQCDYTDVIVTLSLHFQYIAWLFTCHFPFDLMSAKKDGTFPLSSVPGPDIDSGH